MPIEEKKWIGKNGKEQFEIRATGKDTAALKGMLKESSEQSLAKWDEHNKEVGLVEIRDKNGNLDTVHGDKVQNYEKKGARLTRKSFVVPELPWMKNG